MKRLWNDAKADPVGAFLYVLMIVVSSGALAIWMDALLWSCP